MQILKISNIGIQPVINYEQKRNQYSTPQFGLVMNSPINNDVVSFKATYKGAQKTMEVTYKTACIVNKEASKFQKKIVKGMHDLYGDLIATELEPENPILVIADRVKTPESIKEKSGSRQWYSVDEILAYMEDINGVKTVFRNPQRNVVDSALERLIPLIKSRIVRIHEVENKRPMVVKGLPEYLAAEYDYASIPILEKIIRIQEEVLNGKDVIGKKQTVRHNLTDDFTDANYCAIHIIMEFLGKYSRVFEWQIMGKDMAIGKKIDDLVYKILDGKQVPKRYSKIVNILAPLKETNAKYKEMVASNEAYKNFTLDDFLRIATDEDWKRELSILIKFNEYRGKVLLFQRSKGAKPFSTAKIKERFLPLDSDIDSELDYNNLYELMENADHKASLAARKKAAKDRLDSSKYYF